MAKTFKAKPRRAPRDRQPLAEEQASADGERLQKVLAAAGVGSRRECEALILEGRIAVDGEVITKLGTKVDPAAQEIRVDGEALPRTKHAYYMVHKPAGVVCTSRDPDGRPRVIDMLPPTAGRLFTVGRLDMESEGLILLTNDGELANRLTHPRYGVEKTYHVQVAGQLEPDVLIQLRRGVHLAEGVARVVGAHIKGHHKNSTIIEMVLNEGRNREIRRLLARVGHKVQRLIRTAVGPVKLGNLPSGAYRPLDREEVQELRKESRRPPEAARAHEPAAEFRPPAAPASEESVGSPAERRPAARPSRKFGAAKRPPAGAARGKFARAGAKSPSRPQGEGRSSSTGRPAKWAGRPKSSAGGRPSAAPADDFVLKTRAEGERTVIGDPDDEAPQSFARKKYDAQENGGDTPSTGSGFKPRGRRPTGTGGQTFAGKKFADKKFATKKFTAKKFTPASEAADTAATDSESPGKKYPEKKYPGKKFAGKKFAGKKFGGSKFAGNKFNDQPTAAFGGGAADSPPLEAPERPATGRPATGRGRPTTGRSATGRPATGRPVKGKGRFVKGGAKFGAGKPAKGPRKGRPS